MSYKSMMKITATETAGNALRFATRAEAEGYALNLFSRWTVPTGYSVEESADPVNYKYVDGQAVSLPEGGEA